MGGKLFGGHDLSELQLCFVAFSVKFPGLAPTAGAFTNDEELVGLSYRVNGMVQPRLQAVSHDPGRDTRLYYKFNDIMVM